MMPWVGSDCQKFGRSDNAVMIAGIALDPVGGMSKVSAVRQGE